VEEGCRRGLGSCEQCLLSSRLVVFGNPFALLGLAGCAVCEKKERDDRKSVRHAPHHLAFCAIHVIPQR